VNLITQLAAISEQVERVERAVAPLSELASKIDAGPVETILDRYETVVATVAGVPLTVQDIVRARWAEGEVKRLRTMIGQFPDGGPDAGVRSAALVFLERFQTWCAAEAKFGTAGAGEDFEQLYLARDALEAAIGQE
jgi:hypothetical protein